MTSQHRGLAVAEHSIPCMTAARRLIHALAACTALLSAGEQCPPSANWTQCCAVRDCAPALATFDDGTTCTPTRRVSERSGRQSLAGPCPFPAAPGTRGPRVPYYYTLHVPKTGGSSAKACLARLAEYHARAINASVSRAHTPNRAAIAVGGVEVPYFEFRASGWIAGVRGVRLVAIVRSPVPHTRSVYGMLNYNKYSPEHRRRQRLGLPSLLNMTYAQWLLVWKDAWDTARANESACPAAAVRASRLTTGTTWHAANMQTYFWGARTPPTAPAAGGGGHARGPWAVIWCHFVARDGEAALARAHGLLRAAWLMGVTSRMEALWHLGLRRLGLPPHILREALQDRLWKRRVTHNTGVEALHIRVEGAVLGAAQAINSLDGALYEHASARLQADLDATDGADGDASAHDPNAKPARFRDGINGSMAHTRQLPATQGQGQAPQGQVESA